MLPTPILQLQRCLVRPFDESDALHISASANSTKISQYMRNTFPHPYTIKDAQTWISIAKSGRPNHHFAICLPDGVTVIGSIGLKYKNDLRDPVLEVGYWVGEEHWNKGIATEVLSAFVTWSFEAFGTLRKLEAEVVATNTASIRVLEKVGFAVEEGRKEMLERNGRVMDCVILYKSKDA